MPRNLELKARAVSEMKAVRSAKKLDIHSKAVLHQRDIYYNVNYGRLKLRIIKSRKAELIYYRRPDVQGNRISEFKLIPVSEPKLLNEILLLALGKKIEVEKKRRLFLYKNARIHIDNVKKLGIFIEFEVLVKHGIKQAKKLMDFLIKHFNIRSSDVIAVSYSDLLLKLAKKRNIGNDKN